MRTKYLGISTHAQLVMHSKEPSCAWVDGTAHMKPHSRTILELTCIKVVTHGERTIPSIAWRTLTSRQGEREGVGGPNKGRRGTTTGQGSANVVDVHFFSKS